MLPNGTVLQQPLTTAELYQAFRECVAGDASHVACSIMRPGRRTATFTDTNFPTIRYHACRICPANVVAAGAQAVAATGITDRGAAGGDGVRLSSPAAAIPTSLVRRCKARSRASRPRAATIRQAARPRPSSASSRRSPPSSESQSGPTDVTFDVYLTAAESDRDDSRLRRRRHERRRFQRRRIRRRRCRRARSRSPPDKPRARSPSPFRRARSARCPSEDVALQISSPGDDVPIFAPTSVEAVTQATATAPTASASRPRARVSRHDRHVHAERRRLHAEPRRHPVRRTSARRCNSPSPTRNARPATR